MQISGQRHAFLAKYKAAALPAPPGSGAPPSLLGLDVELFSNGGCALDLSGPVMDRAILHLDSCYRWPSLRVRGRVCRTHQPPHTAFRGFGGPQGMMVAEAILDHLCCAARADPVALRTASLYAQGDATHFGQPLELWNVPRAWAELQQSAAVAERRAAVAAFNSAHAWRKRGLALLPTKFGIVRASRALGSRRMRGRGRVPAHRAPASRTPRPPQNFTAKFMNQGGALVVSARARARARDRVRVRALRAHARARPRRPPDSLRARRSAARLH